MWIGGSSSRASASSMKRCVRAATSGRWTSPPGTFTGGRSSSWREAPIGRSWRLPKQRCRLPARPSQAASSIRVTTSSLPGDAPSRPRSAIGPGYGVTPSSPRTMVGVATLLATRAALEAQLERLEVHYLASPEGELYVALLSDWTDAPSENAAGDAALLDIAVAGIERLNRLHGTGAAGD